jgi:hypothetical protein
MKKALIFLKHEFLEMLPPTIFFFVVFHIIAFMRVLMAEQYGITITSSASATIGALIVGKSILVANAIPFVNWFRQKRLIYNVVWKTSLYVIIVLLFQCIEELIPLISKYGAILTAGEHLFEEIKWPRFWATHILLILFLIAYNVTAEVIGAIGRNKIIEIFSAPGVVTRPNSKNHAYPDVAHKFLNLLLLLILTIIV